MGLKKDQLYLKILASCTLLLLLVYYLISSNSNRIVSEELRLISLDNITKYKITVDDIFIGVKTTKRNNRRLQIIFNTWFQLAKNQTWFFTDGNDSEQQQKTNNHMINTNCPSDHTNQALSCKIAFALNTYFNTTKLWFCNFDDDNYVNIPKLVELLENFNPEEDWYLGRKSKPAIKICKPKIIWFGTGGAGICISRGLAEKMIPVAGGDRYKASLAKTGSPDDVLVGYLIGCLLGVPLTLITRFHSHLENLRNLERDIIPEQVSFGYKQSNVIDIEGFNETYDPTRFLSLHCFLFPNTTFCTNKTIVTAQQLNG